MYSATNETSECVTITELQVIPYVRDLYLPLTAEETQDKGYVVKFIQIL